ncbi:uncharacterized protein LOC113340520 [Papaver somniferum]|uniref:uncharacterized protein LOC113340520 n=1 Tax=Papaver somniferum TaxID=3469 RepID=UPI000E6F4B02|nr:uncharacterized protein LOC113340520 [Papaver somniferum]
MHVHNIDDICPLCGREKENVEHLFLHCFVVHRIWFAMDATVLASVRIRFISCILWNIWTLRCSIIFDNMQFRHVEFIHCVNCFISNIERNIGHVQAPSVSSLSNPKWKAPSQDAVKINFDVSFVSKDLPIGMGLIARNSSGEFLGTKGTTDITVYEEQGEATAAVEAIKWAAGRNIYVLHLEGDNKNVVDAIDGRTGGIKWTINNVILECLNLLSAFNNWKCSHVKREANSIDDDIAKYMQESTQTLNGMFVLQILS